MSDTPAPLSRRQTITLAGLATLGGVLVSPTLADEIDGIERELTTLRTSYEDLPLAVTVPALKAMHDKLIYATHRRGHPRLRSTLARVTSQAGALRADALFNVGQVGLARRVASHSVSVGRLSGDPAAFSNATRVRAGIEVFEGRPAHAVAYAGEGIDETTPAGIACLVQRARGAALAGVDTDQVNRLSDQALNAAYSLPATVHGIPGDEHPGTCSPIETAYHASIASAVAGDLFRADGYADLALPHLPPGFQSVVHAHLAVAAVRSSDLDRSLVEARRAITSTPFRALTVPLSALVQAWKPYRSEPGVMTAAADIEGWHRTATVDV